MITFLEEYRFKRNIIRLFEEHQYELVTDSGIDVEKRPDADKTVYALGFKYCCDHNLHLSMIQKIKSYFTRWVSDRDIERTMRVW